MTIPRTPDDMDKWNHYTEHGTGGPARAVRAFPWLFALFVVLSAALCVYAVVAG
jgi:hypothetical protein